VWKNVKYIFNVSKAKFEIAVASDTLSKVDKFESEVIDWVKSADSLKTITLTGVNVQIFIR
jgi:hypothetical protein